MTDMEIYFDNSATTKLCREAAEALAAVNNDIYGNPSSLHAAGLAAEKILRESRAALLSFLSAPKEDTLVFCGSGSEANNLALLGSAHAKHFRGEPTIITDDSEHPSVAESVAALEREGFRVIRIPTRGGALDKDAIDAAASESAVIASFMTVNNETGAVYDVADAFTRLRRANPNIICHTDATQAAGKIALSKKALTADMITVSSHKIHGPKGVGALLISKNLITQKRIVPVILGGGQEGGLRSGTENLAGIAGFAAAARAASRDTAESGARCEEIRKHILEAFATDPRFAEITPNLPAVAAPHILNFTLPKIKSETMLHFLSSRGIYVSSGSACSSHRPEPSKTLLAFGKTADEAGRSLRVSFCGDNTGDEADLFLIALADGINSLVRYK